MSVPKQESTTVMSVPKQESTKVMSVPKQESTTVMSVPKQESTKVMYICVRISILPLSTNLIMAFGTVPTVWYFFNFFLHFIRISANQSPSYYRSNKKKYHNKISRFWLK
jgi:hypothetical protein